MSHACTSCFFKKKKLTLFRDESDILCLTKKLQSLSSATEADPSHLSSVSYLHGKGPNISKVKSLKHA